LPFQYGKRNCGEQEQDKDLQELYFTHIQLVHLQGPVYINNLRSKYCTNIVGCYLSNYYNIMTYVMLKYLLETSIGKDVLLVMLHLLK